jgi:hypothetical protein
MEGAIYLSGEVDVVEQHLDASMQEERVREEETTDEVVMKD